MCTHDSQMTWADLAFIDMCGLIALLVGDVSQMVANYPKLQALREKVEKTPNVAEWLEKRPPPSFV